MASAPSHQPQSWKGGINTRTSSRKGRLYHRRGSRPGPQPRHPPRAGGRGHRRRRPGASGRQRAVPDGDTDRPHGDGEGRRGPKPADHRHRGRRPRLPCAQAGPRRWGGTLGRHTTTVDTDMVQNDAMYALFAPDLAEQDRTRGRLTERFRRSTRCRSRGWSQQTSPAPCSGWAQTNPATSPA
jgi:hypothetical protein